MNKDEIKIYQETILKLTVNLRNINKQYNIFKYQILMKFWRGKQTIN